ncbi:MBL fold metallo-hydrolase [Nocardioides campestrisoli]|uniref:MBL fold metallo-hydrolase n=1 Tax=Nocardioides campestrisoli TaxID=2736757 RepID=UPI0015E73FCB|nr:MBL fold metallo-hydrolase [Nocardioides campestrisoli]
MRLRLGRPDVEAYAGLRDLTPAVPGATPADGPSVTWLGVSTVLLDDGKSAVLTDGFFSRPGLLRTGLGRLVPDEARIDEALGRAEIDRLDAVLPVHTHYDHVLDSATVARRTGALVVGGESTALVARGHGLSEDRIRVVAAGEPLTIGAYEITLVEGSHCPPDRFPGRITEPVPRRARSTAYRCGEAWSTLLHHVPSGRRLMVQGSAGCVPGNLAGHRAEVVYLGIGQLGLMEPAYVEQYWAETVGRVGAQDVVLVHWDDFFRPLTAPVRGLPYAGDDLDVTMERLGRLAQRDGVRLHLPELWVRTDPWATSGARAADGEAG